LLWNYLYLSQKLAEIDDPAKREELLQAMAHGSAAAWGHLNLLGEYEFSQDKPALARRRRRVHGGAAKYQPNTTPLSNAL